jgi:monofunctional biosynthetic peptidoglycan transglycosylase
MGESPGNSTTASQSTRRYRVAGMSSTNCAGRVERALKSLPGVESATVDLDRSEVLIRISSGIDDTSLAEIVEHAGYTLLIGGDTEPHPPPEHDDAGRQSEPPPSRSWRDFIPSAATVWVVATRGAAIGLVISLVWTLALRFLPAPFTLLMVSESLFEGKSIRHTWVPLERISPNLVRAVIASEDDGFCRHWGFDFEQLQDAFKEAQNGGRMRGASTISQQTAKNVFLWPGRSYIRKGFEAYFTVLIEALWPKRRIMEVYLNVIEWGPGVFGAEAASRRWFGKSAARLTPLEAARLAAILPNPNRYRANPPGPYVNDRSYTIAARANSVSLYGEDRCAKP